MRTIAIVNQKGGCGKTTCSINLAATLAAQGRRTLLVDMDPQAHCALGLAVPEAQVERSTVDLLRAGLDGSLAVADAVWQVARNFDLVPSTMGLAAIEQQLGGAHDRDRRLTQVLSTVGDLYEFCIIDCPPSIGLLTFNALRAADEVVVPVETGYFAMQGAIKQTQTIEMIARRAGHDIRFSVLATMYDVRTKLAREILSELRRHFGPQLLPMVINFNSKLKEAASFGQPITEYDGASRGMQDFEQLAAWLMDNPPAPPRSPAADAAPMGGPASPPDEAGLGGSRISRAAELVARARELTSRTAQVSSEIDARAGAIGPGAGPVPAGGPAAVLAPAASFAGPAISASSGSGAVAAASASGPSMSIAPAVVVEQPDPSPAAGADPDLAARLKRLYGVRDTPKGLLFVQPAGHARSAAIAADFNQWNPDQTPMTRDPNLGVWRAVVPLPPGRYRYRLVLDGQWVRDPHNQSVETNPFGELNSIAQMTCQLAAG